MAGAMIVGTLIVGKMTVVEVLIQDMAAFVSDKVNLLHLKFWTVREATCLPLKHCTHKFPLTTVHISYEIHISMII